MVKKLLTSPLGGRSVRTLWFRLLPLGQFFSDASLLGLQVRQFVPVMCCMILVTQGPRFWPLRTISMVGSALAVLVGCVTSFLTWLAFLGSLQFVALAWTVGLLGVIRVVSVQPGDSVLRTTAVAMLVVVHRFIRPRKLCPSTPLRIQLLKTLRTCGLKLVVCPCLLSSTVPSCLCVD